MKPAGFLLLALSLAAAPAAAQTEPLGRLFYTPEQRSALDRLRLQGRSASPDNTPLTLNGRVTRSGGRNTAWINGVPLDEQEARSLGPLPARPGETTFGPTPGEKTDLLNGGTITVKRPPTSNHQ